MQCCFPAFRYRREGALQTWRGTLQPREGGTIYTVRVAYAVAQRGCSPRVVVLCPALDETAPHRFSDGTLCLYHPNDVTRWMPDRFIADTIVPWTAEWLLFYELWVDTGAWWGPEVPHRDGASKLRTYEAVYATGVSLLPQQG
jgi:hypothetical protein